MLKFLWVDTETTGTDPVKNDIIQLSGIIDSENGGEEFNFRIRPFAIHNVDPEATKSHGITVEKMKSFGDPLLVHKLFKTVLNTFVNPFDKKDKFILAGHNVGFDSDMILNFFKKCEDPYWFSYVNWAVLDLRTLLVLFEMSKGHKVFPDYTLSTACNLLNVSLTNAHDSLADIRATRECCIKIWNIIR